MSRSRRFLVRASLVVAVMAAAVVVAELIVRRVRAGVQEGKAPLYVRDVVDLPHEGRERWSVRA